MTPIYYTEQFRYLSCFFRKQANNEEHDVENPASRGN